MTRALLCSLTWALTACVLVPPSGGPAAAAADPEVLMEPGVSRALAQHRTRTLADPAYRLHFDVRERDRVRGRVEITFARTADGGDLVVDFRGSELGRVRVNGASVPDPEWRNGHLRLPAALLRTGPNRLSADFSAPIAAAGTSLIRVEEGEERFLYTLLVPSDAHGLFPSFDQPDLKGRFTLSVTAPQEWTVVANAPLAERREEEVGTTGWHFAQTEPISTYLVAFAAGPWAAVETGFDDGSAITTYLRPSRLEDADPGRIAGLNQAALRWLEGYFGLAYPFAKLDLLLAPAFPFGGMEHVGLVYYNESRFVFREPPTLTRRLGRKGTIYHEIAHQWFGDLVTMAWFDDLWLKEGFATLMGAKVQEALDPGTGAWKTFHLRNKPSAYGIDGTRGTTPVWQELPNLDLAKSVYGPIVYDKAPGILRQLEHLVGEDAFREGVRLFLARHAYAAADWRDLLAAIGEAAGRDLADFGRHYVLRAGMPRIETELEVAQGRIRELALVQRPARELPGDPGGWWPGRVRVRLGHADGEDVLLPVELTGERTVVAGAAGRPVPAFVYPNDGDFGYGLFLLDDLSAAYLLAAAGTIGDDLLRAMVWGSLVELVRAGRLSPARFLEAALAGLEEERDDQISALLVARLLSTLERHLPEAERVLLHPRVERAMLVRAGREDIPVDLRRDALDAFVRITRSEAGQDTLLAFLREERTFLGEPLEQPARWRVVRTLVALGRADPDSLIAAEGERDGSSEAEREAFIAGAARPDPVSKRRYFERYLDDPRLNEEWVTASLGAFLHPLHRELVSDFLEPALERLEWIREHRRIFFLPAWVNAFVGTYPERETLGVVDRFLDARPDLPADLRRRILHPRDELERAVRVRERRG